MQKMCHAIAEQKGNKVHEVESIIFHGIVTSILFSGGYTASRAGQKVTLQKFKSLDAMSHTQKESHIEH